MTGNEFGVAATFEIACGLAEDVGVLAPWVVPQPNIRPRAVALRARIKRSLMKRIAGKL